MTDGGSRCTAPSSLGAAIGPDIWSWSLAVGMDRRPPFPHPRLSAASPCGLSPPGTMSLLLGNAGGPAMISPPPRAACILRLHPWPQGQPLLRSLCRRACDTHDLLLQQGSSPPNFPPLPRCPACIFLPLNSSDRRITLQAQRSSDTGDRGGWDTA